MTTKLAVKHKDSLALKENRLHGKNCVINKQSRLKRYEHLFPWSTLCVFLTYWFVLCPLIWAICYTFAYWTSYWSFLFWVVAFLIWLVIMCGLIIFWKRLQVKQSLEINVVSKYGSDNARSPLNVNQISTDAEFLETKKRNDSESKKSDRENLRKDLPPLVIHKQISGENIEDTVGVVRFEEDEKTRLSIASNYAEKNPLQDYLKLVTVSPSEDEVKSPKTPLSPRQLFFIDLIREAERVESARSLKTRTHFFPSEATENDNAETVKGIKDEKDKEDVKDRKSMKDVEEDAKDKKDSEANELRSKRETSYFIADVESPTSEKTEVFLQINSNEGEETELIVEKPMLILQTNETNSQETSTSPS
ncbi:uncharacterized protein [Temnothorax longispinosus]|uniref:uncharacterized protein n=1 Tax=Temnothorax longispinosus TaxID=300112 RepID=UPI003A9A2709